MDQLTTGQILQVAPALFPNPTNATPTPDSTMIMGRAALPAEAISLSSHELLSILYFLDRRPQYDRH
ncbi:hypothetical protein ACEPAF_435 [Sanghuangporus sanghuang]